MDVVISNCVINLSADKDQVFREIYRVLKPGGRLAVSDIVTTRPLPEGLRKNLLAWAGCVAGALTDDEYKAKLTGVGFENPEVVVTRVYDLTGKKARQLAPWASSAEMEEFDGAVVSAFIRAKKPARLLRVGRDIAIEEAGAADFPAIVDLLTRSGLPVEGVRPDAGTYYIAKAGSMLGVLGVETCATAAVLRSFAVEPAARKAGIGKVLVEHVLAKLKTSGYADLYLLTNTAEGYFANYGFTDTGRGQLPAEVLSSAIFTADCCASCSCKALKL